MNEERVKQSSHHQEEQWQVAIAVCMALLLNAIKAFDFSETRPPQPKLDMQWERIARKSTFSSHRTAETAFRMFLCDSSNVHERKTHQKLFTIILQYYYASTSLSLLLQTICNANWILSLYIPNQT